MATEKAPTKAEFLELLSEKGINTLEGFFLGPLSERGINTLADLVDAMFPETGGYRILYSENLAPLHLLTISHWGSFNLNWVVRQTKDMDEGLGI